jgi:outer membrane protein
MKNAIVFKVLAVTNTVLIAVLFFFNFTGRSKVVYVDSARLLSEYKGMQHARAAYQKKAGAWKANIDTLAGDVQRQIFKYEKESPRMTARERELSQELIRTKQKQFAEYQQATSSQAQQEDAKMTREVVTQVNAYLKKYGESHGYTVILAATEYGNLAYADEGLDITKEVLEGLNKQYEGQ